MDNIQNILDLASRALAEGNRSAGRKLKDLAKRLDGQSMEHIRGALHHPMTQGKIERWHQTLKNRLLLDNYYLPREHGYLPLADVYFGRGQTILIERERTKRQTFANRRVMGRQQAA